MAKSEPWKSGEGDQVRRHCVTGMLFSCFSLSSVSAPVLSETNIVRQFSRFRMAGE